MFDRTYRLWLYLLCLYLGSLSFGHARSFDANTLRNQGKKHYNQKRYQKAQDSFIKLLQHKSNKASDYQKLAYAAYYNQDYLTSALAYLYYFELKKIKNPQDPTYLEVKGKIKKNTDLKRKRLYRVKVEDILHLIKDRKLFKKDEAIDCIRELHKSNIIEPRIQRIYYQLKKAIQEDTKSLVTRWLNPTQQLSIKTLETYKTKLVILTESTWGDSEDYQQGIDTINALLSFDKSPQKLLKFSQNYPQQSIEIKTLQVIALHALGRCQEAYLLTDALVQDYSLKDHANLFFMKGILALECKQTEGVESLIQVLQAPL